MRGKHHDPEGIVTRTTYVYDGNKRMMVRKVNNAAQKRNQAAMDHTVEEDEQGVVVSDKIISAEVFDHGVSARSSTPAGMPTAAPTQSPGRN